MGFERKLRNRGTVHKHNLGIRTFSPCHGLVCPGLQGAPRLAPTLGALLQVARGLVNIVATWLSQGGVGPASSLEIRALPYKRLRWGPGFAILEGLERKRTASNRSNVTIIAATCCVLHLM